MSPATMIPATGMMTSRDDAAHATSRPTEGPNPLERLIQILRQNEDGLRRLVEKARRLDRVRAYASDPTSSPTLADALVEREKKAYANLLATLRKNRVEAVSILRACGHSDVS